MGAWGLGVFDNDDALDWVAELEEGADVSLLQESLNIECLVGDYVDLADANRAMAAAEVVAALSGAGRDDLPETVQEWVGQQPEVQADLVVMALAAIERIKAHSELKELWEQSDAASQWQAVVDDLEGRLRRITAG